MCRLILGRLSLSKELLSLLKRDQICKVLVAEKGLHYYSKDNFLYSSFIHRAILEDCVAPTKIAQDPWVGWQGFRRAACSCCKESSPRC